MDCLRSYYTHFIGVGIFSSKCHSKARLDGKTAIITGCNTGIGKVAAEEFVRRGAHVVMACRDIRKAEEAAKAIREATRDAESVGSVTVLRLDLASLASVRQFAAEVLAAEPQIHLLINNAGIMTPPKSLTEDGFEVQFGVNHLGHFLLTCLLLPRLRRCAPSRIVTLASVAHIGGKINFDDLQWEKSYSASWAYSQSKLANILFSQELGERLKGTGVTTYSLHPGIIATELGRYFDDTFFKGLTWMFNSLSGLFIKRPEQGVQTTLYCALDEDLAQETGLYYSECRKCRPTAAARDPVVARKLWDVSAQLTGLDFDPFTAPDTPPGE